MKPFICQVGDKVITAGQVSDQDLKLNAIVYPYQLHYDITLRERKEDGQVVPERITMMPNQLYDGVWEW